MSIRLAMIGAAYFREHRASLLGLVRGGLPSPGSDLDYGLRGLREGRDSTTSGIAARVELAPIVEGRFAGLGAGNPVDRSRGPS